ncbi:MAG: 3-methyladenine DNA glycosylase [Planctomycetota bacterium]
MLETKIQNKKQWQEHANRHGELVRQWTDPFRRRRKSGASHPVDDFLFIYYRFSPAKLEQWHPGSQHRLEGQLAEHPQFDPRHYTQAGNLFFCDPQKTTEKEKARVEWTVDMLRQTSQRRGNFSCLGMHEWAMVYQGQEIRHESTTQFRLSQTEIDQFVESRPMTCSHFDAFRFFADSARPLNRVQPTLESRPELEQPACIHANMDLYKWAFKSMPWVGSDIVRDCFLLALKAREIDMRASPYDLQSYGHYEPIKVETIEGRKQYEQEQRAISEDAQDLRRRLIQNLVQIIAGWDGC